ncbi:MAG: Gfo/Idh/MocA family oxidoreductase [Planctomycetes bacterium]|nr:Gfo/Idh/MocA family oxidoreductase [Planctomycetota bacterium]
MRRLRLAVVGVGHLGRIHARLMLGLENVELAAVVDPVESNRFQVAVDCGAQALADHRELFGRVDAAVIATPTRFHHRVGMELLSQGIHLLIEKPLAGSLAEAEELAAAAERLGLVLQVGHVERFNPAWTAILPHLREPKYIEATRCGPFSFRSTDIGAVLDIMIHDLDLVLSLVHSRLVHVEALGLAVLGRHEDVANARLTFENGCVAALSASRVSSIPRRSMQVWTPRRFARIDFAERTADVVSPSEAVLGRQIDVERMSATERDQLKADLFEKHLSRETLSVDRRDALTAELEDFVTSIREGHSPRVDGRQGQAVLAAAEQILSKIGAHRWEGSVEGPTGPQAIPAPRIVPAPHWDVAARQRSRKQAG